MYSLDTGVVVHHQKDLCFMLTFRNQILSDCHLQHVAPKVTMVARIWVRQKEEKER